MTAPWTIPRLRDDYAAGRLDPKTLAADLRERSRRCASYRVWIRAPTEAALDAEIGRLADLDPDAAPLWGIPFAIKDNVDWAHVPTTAACPAYAYAPERSATVVERLVAAGAVPVGKTNMDQFATGLVGTRSPYGAVRNALHPEAVAGGSSSGSAVAVRLGLAAFALGTDTAGSGRVPAAFNGLVGFKPTRGWWSTRGVVPACRTLDCVSVFTHTVADAREVAQVAGGFDAEDPFSRPVEFAGFAGDPPRYGLVPPADLPFFGNEAYRTLYRQFVERLPGATEAVDPAPFFAAGELLYDGPWLAERYAAIRTFFDTASEAVHPVVRTIIGGGRSATAADCFEARYRLATLKREAERVFEVIDVLVLPTAPTIYTRAEVRREPYRTNARLGAFTNFVNLLDLCAVAIPGGTTPDALPFGVTLIALAGRDHALLNAAASLRGEPMQPAAGDLHLAVCGAHMTGEPRNSELTQRGGVRIALTRTAPRYGLYALADGDRPALVRRTAAGAAIEVEVWRLPEGRLGGFLRTIAPPLGIGSVELADGSWINGFIAEGIATADALDITRFGGWRDYRAAGA